MGVGVDDVFHFRGGVAENRFKDRVRFFKFLTKALANFPRGGFNGRVVASGDKIGEFSDVVKDVLFVADSLVVTVLIAKKIKNVGVKSVVFFLKCKKYVEVRGTVFVGFFGNEGEFKVIGELSLKFFKYVDMDDGCVNVGES